MATAEEMGSRTAPVARVLQQLNPKAIGIDNVETRCAGDVWFINRCNSGTSQLLCDRRPIEPFDFHAEMVDLSRHTGSTQHQERVVCKVQPNFVVRPWSSVHRRSEHISVEFAGTLKVTDLK